MQQQPQAPPTAAEEKRVPLVEYVWLLVLSTLWGSSFSLLKITVGTIPPLTAIAVRTAIAGALLIWIMRRHGVGLPLDPKSLKSFAIVSLVNTVAPFILIAWGLKSLDAGLTVILNSTTPIFAFLITLVLLRTGSSRAEQVTPRKLLGVVVGIAGIVLIVGAEALTGLGQHLVPQLAIVLASVSYAISAIYGSAFRGMSPMAPAAGSLLIGTAVLTPMAIVMEHPWTASPSLASVVALIVLGVACTALGNVLYFRLLGTLGSLGTTAQSYLRVPIGVLVGILLIGEKLTPTAGIGLVCVVVGVAAMTITAPMPPWLIAARYRALQRSAALLAPAAPVARYATAHLRRFLAMTTARNSPPALEYVLLVVIATLWAGSYVWIKIALGSLPPLSLMAGRLIIAGLFLLAVLHWSGRRLPGDEASWRMFTVQGLFASVLPFTLVAWGQQWVATGPTAILNSISPVFAFLITWGITRHEPATLQKFVGVLAGLVGVAIVIGPHNLLASDAALVPEFAIVVSSFCYACSAIYSRHFRSADAIVTATGSMLTGAILLVPVAILVDRPWTLQPTAAAIAAMLALGVVSTGLGYVLYFRLIRTLGPLGVTAQSYLRAPIGVLLSALLLGEAVTLSTLAGLALVVAGVAAMTLPTIGRPANA